jgi:S-adenosylmethionine/arginine decarboxylase-like enzyme
MDKNHKHFILNSIVKNPINDEESCKKWLTDLVKVVNMDILVPAMAKYCDIPGNEGVTGTIIITTSHMSVHIWPLAEKPYIRMDVYSCKDFDAEAVLNYVNETMGVAGGSYVVLNRNNELLPLHFMEHKYFGEL